MMLRYSVTYSRLVITLPGKKPPEGDGPTASRMTLFANVCAVLENVDVVKANCCSR